MPDSKIAIVVGAGFAGLKAAKALAKHEGLRVILVDRRNHHLFQPLLYQVATAGLNPSDIAVPIRVQFRGAPNVEIHLGHIDGVDLSKQIVFGEGHEIGFDYLILACGARHSYFGHPEWEEFAPGLKTLEQATEMRRRMLVAFERAENERDPDTQRAFLTFVVVGGGPTGVEFAAELHDLIDESLRDNYPDLVGIPRITLFEAMPTILGNFDKELRDYTMNHFMRQGIELQLEKKVTEVVGDELHFDDGSIEAGGLIVWSTGYAPTDLVRNAPFGKDHGRLITDNHLRIPDYPDVYAAGDCAVIAGASSPQTAQFAMQAGKYLGKAFNRIAEGKDVKEFEFNDLGMLAYIGNEEALAEVPKARLRWHGALTYLAWRSAYLTRLVSFKNKVLVLLDWIKTRVFGRDMSKF